MITIGIHPEAWQALSDALETRGIRPHQDVERDGPEGRAKCCAIVLGDLQIFVDPDGGLAS